MDLQGVTPAMEALWIDEVRYLHALWRRGPPGRPDSSLQSPKSASDEILHRCIPTPKQGKKTKKKTRLNAAIQAGLTVSDIEWASKCPAETPAEAKWPPENSQLLATRPATTEELAMLSAIQIQKDAIKLSKDFLNERLSDGEDDGGDFLDEDNGSESETLEFFLGLFSRDGDLRRYYEKNWESGEFSCLVCWGMGKKVGKRFKDCVALVQHSMSISKTKMKEAHRVFGQAVCRILGWEVDRLPSIVLCKREPRNGTRDQGASQEQVNEEGNSLEKEGGQEENLGVSTAAASTVEMRKIELD